MSYRSRFNAYTTTEDGSIPDGNWSWPDMYPGGPASGAGRVPPQQQAGIVRPRLIRAMVEAIAAASVRMAPELTPPGFESEPASPSLRLPPVGSASTWSEGGGTRPPDAPSGKA